MGAAHVLIRSRTFAPSRRPSHARAAAAAAATATAVAGGHSEAAATAAAADGILAEGEYDDMADADGEFDFEDAGRFCILPSCN